MGGPPPTRTAGRRRPRRGGRAAVRCLCAAEARHLRRQWPAWRRPAGPPYGAPALAKLYTQEVRSRTGRGGGPVFKLPPPQAQTETYTQSWHKMKLMTGRTHLNGEQNRQPAVWCTLSHTIWKGYVAVGSSVVLLVCFDVSQTIPPKLAPALLLSLSLFATATQRHGVPGPSLLPPKHVAAAREVFPRGAFAGERGLPLDIFPCPSYSHTANKHNLGHRHTGAPYQLGMVTRTEKGRARPETRTTEVVWRNKMGIMCVVCVVCV